MQQPSAHRNDLHSHWLHAVPQALVHLQAGAGQGRRAIANQAGRLRSLSATGRPRSSKLEHRLAAHKQRCCTAVAGPHPHLSKAAASQQPIAAVWPFGNLNLCRQAAQTAKGERHVPRRLVNGGVESIAQAEAAGRQHAGLAAAPGRYQETPCSTAVAGANWQLAARPLTIWADLPVAPGQGCAEEAADAAAPWLGAMAAAAAAGAEQAGCAWAGWSPCLIVCRPQWRAKGQVGGRGVSMFASVTLAAPVPLHICRTISLSAPPTWALLAARVLLLSNLRHHIHTPLQRALQGQAAGMRGLGGRLSAHRPA